MCHSGALTNCGRGAGRGFALNLPLAAGLRDDLFAAAFQRLVGGAFDVYRPDCVVLQMWVVTCCGKVSSHQLNPEL